MTTTAAVQAPGPVPFDKLFAQSWVVFRKNWIVALPPVIAFVVVTAAFCAFAAFAVIWAGVALAKQSVPAGTVTGLLIAYLCLVAIAIVVFLWAYVAMFGMADAAWTRGTATFADGFAAFRERAGAAFLAGVGLFGLFIAAVLLALPTLFAALLAYPVFTMYVIPSVVVGRRGGFEAIGESFRLVLRFFGGSALTVLILYAISYGISMIGAFALIPLQFSVLPTGTDTEFHMPPIPLVVGSVLGYVLSLVVSIAYSGFVATVLVGMYRDLIAQPEPPPAAPPPNP
ncbi:MAG TPA: hypothetical protein VK669_06535 [Candidatus Limnocylindrales bacterium]|nr:hypothetical protein [Candidatus Limnocylindrales bacterium]